MNLFGKLLVILLPKFGNIGMRFGDKLKELRLSKKITQRQIAAELSVAPSIYNRFEKNERRVKREMLSKLASVFAISEDEINKL